VFLLKEETHFLSSFLFRVLVESSDTFTDAGFEGALLLPCFVLGLRVGRLPKRIWLPWMVGLESRGLLSCLRIIELADQRSCLSYSLDEHKVLRYGSEELSRCSIMLNLASIVIMELRAQFELG
jgi:hypothetical protein